MNRFPRILLAASVVALLIAFPRNDARPDDTALLQSDVPPNVVLFVDESGSMRNIVQHPYFDAADAPFVMSDSSTCEVMTLADAATDTFPDETTPTPRTIKLVTGGSTGHRFEPRESELTDWTATASTLDDPDQGYVVRKYCGNDRKIYTDVFLDTYTRTLWPKAYLDWYFHLEPSVVYDDPDPTSTATKTGAEILAEIESPTNGRNYITGDYYPNYQLSRMASAKIVAKEVMYRTNSDCPAYLGDCGAYEDRVRFGIAVFRSGNHGGFVSSPPVPYTTGKSTLETAIDDLITGGSTPLGETLFQLYTYFMKRGTATADEDDRPDGLDGTAFPNYSFQANGTYDSVASNWLPDPIAWDCQKQFIIMVTDGAPTRDLFDTSGSVTPGFSSFRAMIGDYGPDLVTEDDWDQTAPTWSVSSPSKEEGSGVWPQSDSAGYLDDIAKFMQDTDLRGDIAGDQVVDVYTVGFTTIGPVNTMLSKTARNGNGLFANANETDELTVAIVSALQDIIQKSRSFTSATVPASRTAHENSFYYSSFVPRGSNRFWEGNLKNFEFSPAGDILTSDGKCALGADPTATPPCPTSGTIRGDATPVWDAVSAMPHPDSRTLYYGKGNTTMFSKPPGWNRTNIDAVDLDLVAGDLTDLPYSSAADLEDLADKLVRSFDGCEFGTDCTVRSDIDGNPTGLGDVFHANPTVVGNPSAPVNESSYRDFTVATRGRDRVIYTAANDGFLHAFDAGTWEQFEVDGITPLIPPRYTAGYGTELFGFMPSEVRHQLKRMLSVGEDSGVDHYSVDGSPIVADVWMYRDFATAGDPVVPLASSSSKTADQWKTILMGGLRQGGHSYYALDITEPGTTNYPGYLWEFPCDASQCGSSENPGSASWASFMGQTWSEPVITRVRVKVDGGTDPRGYERWVAIFGAGYEKTGDPNHDDYDWDPTTASAAGRAIFMVDVTTGEVLAVKHFSATAVDVGGTRRGYPEMRYAFASAPAVFDLDFDGFADVIYIGDLGGNLWKWVVTAKGDDPINNSLADDNEAQPSWPFRIVFRGSASTEPPPNHLATPADPTTTHYQSFFFPPTGVLRHNSLVLALGAGERADVTAWENDGSDANNNHFYVVRDADPYEDVSPAPNPVTGQLTESDIATNAEVNSLSCSVLQATEKGYMLNGRDAEKFITRSTVFRGELITGSFIPRQPGTATACDGSGEAYAYRFNLDCGTGAYTGNPGGPDAQRRRALGSGLPTRPRVSVGALNQGGGGGGGCENRVVIITSDGSVDNDCAGALPSLGTNIRSWRGL